MVSGITVHRTNLPHPDSKMSIKAMNWAWGQGNIHVGPKLMLLALADHADNDGYCWPGTRGIAEKCGVSRPTLYKYLHSLREANLLCVEARTDGAGRTISNSYQLHLTTPCGACKHGITGVLPQAERLVTPGLPEPSLEPPIEPPVIKAVQPLLNINTEGTFTDILPDDYLDLYSLPGFKTEVVDYLAWNKKEGITESIRKRTAASVKSKWPGTKAKPMKDAWATYRGWAMRERDSPWAQRQKSDRPTVNAKEHPNGKPGGNTEEDEGPIIRAAKEQARRRGIPYTGRDPGRNTLPTLRGSGDSSVANPEGTNVP